MKSLENINTTLESISKVGILIPNKKDITNYLYNHQSMIDICSEMCKAAYQQFGKDSDVSLEVYHDPEIYDDHIVIYIRQEDYKNNLIQRIENFLEKYQTKRQLAKEWITLTTDFSPPTREKLHS